MSQCGGLQTADASTWIRPLKAFFRKLFSSSTGHQAQPNTVWRELVRQQQLCPAQQTTLTALPNRKENGATRTSVFRPQVHEPESIAGMGTVFCGLPYDKSNAWLGRFGLFQRLTNRVYKPGRQ